MKPERIVALLDGCDRKCTSLQFAQLTNFPKCHPQVLVSVEFSSEFVAVIEHRHESQEMFGRNRVVDIVILKQLMCRLDQQQLENTLHNDLLEGSTSLNRRDGTNRFRLVGIMVHRRQRRGSDEVRVA